MARIVAGEGATRLRQLACTEQPDHTRKKIPETSKVGATDGR
jgi:hypothetical protein